METLSGAKRILLKISGEALMGSQSAGVDVEVCHRVALSIKELYDSGREVALVIGGGNIFRGLDGIAQGMDRVPSDYVGMFATIINAMLMQQVLQAVGVEACVMSSLECPKAVESFNRDKAIRHLKNGKIVIFAGGTGQPFFSTDTNAALKSSEIKADLFMKATKVDGVYNKDPVLYSDAVKYDTLPYSQALAEKLKVMDLTSFILCMENNIPIYVFNIFNEAGMLGVLSDKNHGTLIIGE